MNSQHGVNSNPPKSATQKNIEACMPRITLTIGDGETGVYANDEQLFSTKSTEITLSGIPIHKDNVKTVESLIAKETNAARVDELKQLQMADTVDGLHKDYMYMNYIADRIKELSDDNN